MLRIDSTDKILQFINTFIIIIITAAPKTGLFKTCYCWQTIYSLQPVPKVVHLTGVFVCVVFVCHVVCVCCLCVMLCGCDMFVCHVVCVCLCLLCVHTHIHVFMRACCLHVHACVCNVGLVV